MSGEKAATPALDRIRERKPASKRWTVFNLLRGPLFIVIQALAALSLDGWLSVALWVNAAYNALLFVALVGGLAMVAVDAANEGVTP